MDNSFIVYYRKDTQGISFTVIDNPTNTWKDLKIYDMNLKSGTVSVECISKDEDMEYGGEGRKLFVESWFEKNWERESCIDSFRKCITCNMKDCSICGTYNDVLDFRRSDIEGIDK